MNKIKSPQIRAAKQNIKRRLGQTDNTIISGNGRETDEIQLDLWLRVKKGHKYPYSTLVYPLYFISFGLFCFVVLILK